MAWIRSRALPCRAGDWIKRWRRALRRWSPDQPARRDDNAGVVNLVGIAAREFAEQSTRFLLLVRCLAADQRLTLDVAQFVLLCVHADGFHDFKPQAIVIAFGRIRVLEDVEEKRRTLCGLLAKYFPAMAAGQEYRPITDQELKRTSMYAIAVESWSGKRNWPDETEQSEE